MNYQINIYAMILLGSGIAELTLALMIYNTGTAISRRFTPVMLSISIWAIGYGFELMSSSLEQMLFWVDIQYIGIAFLPSLWIIFSLEFVQKKVWLNKVRFLPILAYSLALTLMVWTNEYHHLHYASVSVSHDGPFPLLSLVPGPTYQIHTIYFYIMLLIGSGLFINKFRKSNVTYRRQTALILAGMMIPWVANFMYLSGWRPYEHLDLTPFSFLITSLAVGYGVAKLKLFNILPMARHKVVEQMEEGVIVQNLDNKIIDANASFLRKFSKTESEVLGKKIYQVLPSLGPQFLKPYPSYPGRMSTTLECRNGLQCHFEISIVLLEDSNKRKVGTLCIFKDVTESIKTQEELLAKSEELRNLNLQKDRLFSIISHDLKGPLNSFLQLLQVQQAGEISDEEFKLILPVLTKEVDYTSSMLENLLNWSISQTKEKRIKPVKLNIKQLLDKELFLLNKKAKDKGVEIIMVMDGNTLAYSDMDMTLLIFRNLIANSIKFSESGGQITITANADNDYVHVTVQDTGIGMDEKKVNEILNKEITSTYGTHLEKGTGLGLVLCQDFTHANNGTFTIESKPGQGTKIRVSLPIANSQSSLIATEASLTVP